MPQRTEGWWKVFDTIADHLRADDARATADGILQSIVSQLLGAAAVFAVAEQRRLALVASRLIDQDSLDAVRVVWEASAVEFEQRKERVIGSLAAPWDVGPIARAYEGNKGIGFFPVFSKHLVGLLYVEFGIAPTPEILDLLGRLARMSAVVLRAPLVPLMPIDESYLERTPTDDFERARMLLLLDRNEWNIARVARLMGITRRTLYMRLERYSIPRQKVRKSAPRKA